jgi:MinD-like ATPase involved in chromosome partitioning or flagellar assembly
MGGEWVAAAALTGRLPLARRRAAADAAERTLLAFHQAGGPLVAVCGLAGGAGVSTLAYLLARGAARHSTVPVLLAELDPGGGLAALAEASSSLALGELARAVDEQRTPERPFAEPTAGLRLVASAHPSAAGPLRTGALERLLEDARAAHGLVVVDAGQPTHGETDRLLAKADHLMLCVPATAAGVRRAELQLAGGLLRRTGAGGHSTLVCTATQPGAHAQVRRLRRLADGQVERLLLVPHLPQLARRELDESAFEPTLTALATILRRRA